MTQQERQAPPDSAQARHAAPQTDRRRGRRVGTLTLGIALICAGGLLAAVALVPSMYLLSALRFAPLVLVLLGIEVLVYSFRPGTALRYDGFSIFFCLLLVVGSLGALLVGQVAESEMTADRLRAELGRQSYQALNQISDIRQINFSVSLRFRMLGRTDQQLQDGDEVWAMVELDGSYPDVQSFAQACSRVLQAADQANLPATGYHFFSDGEQSDQAIAQRYDLSLSGEWQRHLTPDQLADQVETEYLYDDVWFSSQQELQDYLDQFQEESETVPQLTAETADQ